MIDFLTVTNMLLTLGAVGWFQLKFMKRIDELETKVDEQGGINAEE